VSLPAQGGPTISPKHVPGLITVQHARPGHRRVSTEAPGWNGDPGCAECGQPAGTLGLHRLISGGESEIDSLRSPSTSAGRRRWISWPWRFSGGNSLACEPHAGGGEAWLCMPGRRWCQRRLIYDLLATPTPTAQTGAGSPAEGCRELMSGPPAWPGTAYQRSGYLSRQVSDQPGPPEHRFACRRIFCAHDYGPAVGWHPDRLVLGLARAGLRV
jgi:hypothetical protein